MSDTHHTLDIADFVQHTQNECIDVRSESEYAHAHIPGAINIPILNDDNRKVVGTLYKRSGRVAAVQKGFELAGPDFHQMISDIRKHSVNDHINLYCWRGGMRSGIMQWILRLAAIDAVVLKGGYKAYRNWVLASLNKDYKFLVLGGKTGSGKTSLLHKLIDLGEQVIDLEGLASHKGSAFGALGMEPQPSIEMFENKLAQNLNKLDPSKPIWIENESRSIGTCIIPGPIFESMRSSTLIELDRSVLKRKEQITKEYGVYSNELLGNCTIKIKKRLGPNNLKVALEHLNNNDFNSWLEMMIEYYDRQYEYGNSLRDKANIRIIDAADGNDDEVIEMLLHQSAKYNP